MVFVFSTDEPDENGYDSDCSLTVAANKSLDLSRSLGDQCAAMTQVDSSDEEGEVGEELAPDEPRAPLVNSAVIVDNHLEFDQLKQLKY